MKRILSVLIAAASIGALMAFMAYPAMAAAPDAKPEKVLVHVDVKLADGQTVTLAKAVPKGLPALRAKIAMSTSILSAEVEPPASAAKYCLNGETVVPPVTLYAAQGSRDMTAGVADLAIAGYGGIFYLGWSVDLDRLVFLFTTNPEDADEFLLPGYSKHHVTAGACGPGKYVPVPRKYLGCGYPAQIDPAEGFSGAPYGVAEALSRTNLQNGWWLICALPSGYRILEGAVVSTGMGGYALDSTGTIPGAQKATPAQVASALKDDPLGWSKIIVRS